MGPGRTTSSLLGKIESKTRACRQALEHCSEIVPRSRAGLDDASIDTFHGTSSRVGHTVDERPIVPRAQEILTRREHLRRVGGSLAHRTA